MKISADNETWNPFGVSIAHAFEWVSVVFVVDVDIMFTWLVVLSHLVWTIHFIVINAMAFWENCVCTYTFICIYSYILRYWDIEAKALLNPPSPILHISTIKVCQKKHTPKTIIIRRHHIFIIQFTNVYLCVRMNNNKLYPIAEYSYIYMYMYVCVSVCRIHRTDEWLVSMLYYFSNHWICKNALYMYIYLYVCPCEYLFVA